MGQKYETCAGNVTVDMNLQELLPVTKCNKGRLARQP